MTSDPRTAHFSALVLNAGRTLPGVWRVMHIGFGEHLFVDANTGDAVPITSVSQAVRPREDEATCRCEAERGSEGGHYADCSRNTEQNNG